MKNMIETILKLQSKGVKVHLTQEGVLEFMKLMQELGFEGEQLEVKVG
jgi:hypothetical protein